MNASQVKLDPEAKRRKGYEMAQRPEGVTVPEFAAAIGDGQVGPLTKMLINMKKRGFATILGQRNGKDIFKADPSVAFPNALTDRPKTGGKPGRPKGSKSKNTGAPKAPKAPKATAAAPSKPKGKVGRPPASAAAKAAKGEKPHDTALRLGGRDEGFTVEELAVERKSSPNRIGPFMRTIKKLMASGELVVVKNAAGGPTRYRSTTGARPAAAPAASAPKASKPKASKPAKASKVKASKPAKASKVKSVPAAAPAAAPAKVAPAAAPAIISLADGSRRNAIADMLVAIAEVLRN